MLKLNAQNFEDLGRPQGAFYHPYFNGVVRYRLDDLSGDPDTQVERTIDLMRRYVLEDCASPLILEDLGRAVESSGGDVLQGVYLQVKRAIQFVRDEAQAAQLPPSLPIKDIIEVLVRPVDVSLMLRGNKKPREDCDGFTMYCAALLCAAGIDCAFGMVAGDARMPCQFSHIYVVAYPGNGQQRAGYRVPMDCSHGEFLGWEAPSRFGKRAESSVRGFKYPGLAAIVAASTVLWMLFKLSRFGAMTI